MQKHSQGLWPVWREGSAVFSLWQDRQRCLTLCEAQPSSTLYGAAWNVSNQFSIVVLVCSRSVIFRGRLSKNPDNATSSSVHRAPSCLSSHFIFSLHYLLIFSNQCVYRIAIIEHCARLPLRAPYVAHYLSFFLLPPPPSFFFLPERA